MEGGIAALSFPRIAASRGNRTVVNGKQEYHKEVAD
jgi:hypothetical protein